jgi:hypothetical protein
VWVKTASVTGGRVIGFSSTQSGTSNTTDRHVYFSNDGHILFGVYDISSQAISSTATYNDNQWHYVVATQDANGLALYVDGAQVASAPQFTQAFGYTGYWRVGGDNLNGWPSQPSSNGLTGSVAEVAVYPVALTPQEVAQHYALR